jgi:hypothetical protein
MGEDRNQQGGRTMRHARPLIAWFGVNVASFVVHMTA